MISLHPHQQPELPLLPNLGVQVVAGALSALSVAPAVSIVDKAIVSNASGLLGTGLGFGGPGKGVGEGSVWTQFKYSDGCCFVFDCRLCFCALPLEASIAVFHLCFVSYVWPSNMQLWAPSPSPLLLWMVSNGAYGLLAVQRAWGRRKKICKGGGVSKRSSNVGTIHSTNIWEFFPH